MFASHHSAPSAQRAGLLLVAGKALLQILPSMARTFPSVKTNGRTAPQTFTANIRCIECASFDRAGDTEADANGSSGNSLIQC